MTSGRWTPHLRSRQAQAIRVWRPWEKSTGPRTPEGKAIVAANARKRLADESAAFAARREQRERQQADVGDER